MLVGEKASASGAEQALFETIGGAATSTDGFVEDDNDDVVGDGKARRGAGSFRIEEATSERGARAATSVSTSLFDFPDAAAKSSRWFSLARWSRKTRSALRWMARD